MTGELPDRVPVMCQLSLGHYFLNCKAPPADIWFSSEAFAKALLELARFYRFDGILVNLAGRPQNWRSHVRERDPTDAGGERLVFDSGHVVEFPPDDNPKIGRADGSGLGRASPDDIDPGDCESWACLDGYVWNTVHAPVLWDRPTKGLPAKPEDFPEYINRTPRLVRSSAPDLAVHAEVFSPFTHLMELFGYERALMALIETPETCEALLARFTESVTARVGRHAEVDIDAVLVSSAFAGAGFISPAMYERFVLPYERKIHQAIASHGLPSYVHTCGAIGDRLEMMAETGAGGIDTLDPAPLGDTELADAKARIGDRVFFKGNLDSVNDLLLGSEERFVNAVRERLEVGKPGGRYILSTACSVAPRVAPERLARLVDFAEEMGRY